MKALCLGNNKNKELFISYLSKLETKFAEREKKLNSLENNVQKGMRSKQLIRNITKKP